MTENEVRAAVEKVMKSLRASRKEMTLALAEEVADFVLSKAKEIGVKAVVCVSDAAGNPKLVKSMDDAYIASYDVAVNKAYTVVALKMSTKKLSTLAKPGESLYGIQFTNGGKIVIFGGGEPLYGEGGKIIGGLGVSGGTEEQDTFLAQVGAKKV